MCSVFVNSAVGIYNFLCMFSLLLTAQYHVMRTILIGMFVLLGGNLCIANRCQF